MSIHFLMEMVLSKSMWLESFWNNIFFIFIIFSLKIFVGWFCFWQGIYRKKLINWSK